MQVSMGELVCILKKKKKESQYFYPLYISIL